MAASSVSDNVRIEDGQSERFTRIRGYIYTMANDFERRLSKLEDRFDEYMSMFYRWLDELRADHEVSKQRILLNEQILHDFIDYSKRQFERNDETHRVMIDILRELSQTQREQGQLLARVVEEQREQRSLLVSTVEALSEQGKVLSGVVETQGILIKRFDNLDKKIDNLGKHGTNGKA
jgi:hypothetical protein